MLRECSLLAHHGQPKKVCWVVLFSFFKLYVSLAFKVSFSPHNHFYFPLVSLLYSLPSFFTILSCPSLSVLSSSTVSSHLYFFLIHSSRSPFVFPSCSSSSFLFPSSFFKLSVLVLILLLIILFSVLWPPSPSHLFTESPFLSPL